MALHGWLDNSNSFVPLLKYLPSNLHIIAIDLPGHGFSSHYGGGAVYSFVDYIVSVMHVVTYMKWDTFTIIGHSLGAIIGIIFTSQFPDRIKNLITIDILIPRLMGSDDIQKAVIRYMELEKREFAEEQMEITWDEALAQFHAKRPISHENAKLLLSRGVKEGSQKGSYIFLRDQRLKMMMDFSHANLQSEIYMESFKNYSGGWLAILQDEKTTARTHDEQQAKENYAKNCKLFKIVHVQEAHFMHMENPELIGCYINEVFDGLSKY